VVSVPAFFNDAQRQATRDAAAIAGIKLARIINEPTAAALAYGAERGKAADGNVLVFDAGSGTVDVSVLRISGTKYDVLATNGDTNLGGTDIDQRIIDHLVTKFEKKTGTTGVRANPKAFQRLRREAESAKMVRVPLLLASAAPRH
jgi:molecular chaperone DnaK (HSP70)